MNRDLVFSPSQSVEHFLSVAVSDDRARHGTALEALWRAAGDENAMAFAIEHECEGIAAIALRRALGDGLPTKWEDAHRKAARSISLLMQELDVVAEALHRRGVPVIALKNAGIARGLFDDPAGCPMGDLDLLIERAHAQTAHAVMLDLGYRWDTRSPLGEEDFADAFDSGGAEYVKQGGDGSDVWVEVNWRVVGGRWMRPDQEPMTEDLMARAVPIPGSHVRLLSAVDNLIQVCLHTAKHSYVRAPGFRLHTDVDRIARHQTVDWKQFLSEVRRLDVATASFFSLKIAADLLNSPVPESVLQALQPSPWRCRVLANSIRGVGLFHPHRPKWNRVSYILFYSLLYDSVGGFLRGAFPARDWMLKRYHIEQRWTLPWWYLVRLRDLLFNRANT